MSPWKQAVLILGVVAVLAVYAWAVHRDVAKQNKASPVILLEACDDSDELSVALSGLQDRVAAGVPLGMCDLMILQDLRLELDQLRGALERERGYCWEELEQCEAGIATDRACRGHEMTRFDEVTDALMDCAKTARGSYEVSSW
jgi:hypothetical protein